MCFQRGVQIDISDDLAVDDDERFVLEKFARIIQRATCAQYHRLFNVMQLHTEPAAITQGSRTESGR